MLSRPWQNRAKWTVVIVALLIGGIMGGSVILQAIQGTILRYRALQPGPPTPTIRLHVVRSTGIFLIIGNPHMPSDGVTRIGSDWTFQFGDDRVAVCDEVPTFVFGQVGIVDENGRRILYYERLDDVPDGLIAVCPLRRNRSDLVVLALGTRDQIERLGSLSAGVVNQATSSSDVSSVWEGLRELQLLPPEPP